MNNFERIQELLNQRAEIQARLNLLPYDGTPEVKTLSNKKYIYIRKRVLDKITSLYVGEFDENLFNQLIKNNIESKHLKKEIRLINKELAVLGYLNKDVASSVVLNIEFARSNLKQIIYDQAVLEGIGTTFPDTESILENGKVKNVKSEDIQKILNLKHAWEFILDKDVISSPSDYELAAYIAKIVNEGFYQNGGRIRNSPVSVGGSSYVPLIPFESDVKDNITNILNSKDNGVDIAINLCLYVMKTQIFNDGNKRTGVIYANHYLISHSLGLLVISFDKVVEFKKKLILYYENKDVDSIKEFLRKCFIHLS